MGWVGVGFYGTLVNQESGAPVQEMVERVQKMLMEGRIVKLVVPDVPSWVKGGIEKFCHKHFKTRLEITDVIDDYMTELWDWRVVRVEKNKGSLLVKM